MWPGYSGQLQPINQGTRCFSLLRTRPGLRCCQSVPELAQRASRIAVWEGRLQNTPSAAYGRRHGSYCSAFTVLKGTKLVRMSANSQTSWEEHGKKQGRRARRCTDSCRIMSIERVDRVFCASTSHYEDFELLRQAHAPLVVGQACTTLCHFPQLASHRADP
jgi:hypothetical protein